MGFIEQLQRQGLGISSDLDGMQDMMRRDPIDVVLEFYGIAKYYKKDGFKLMKRVIKIPDMKEEHKLICSDFLIAEGISDSKQEFFELYDSWEEKRIKLYDQINTMNEESKGEVMAKLQEENIKLDEITGNSTGDTKLHDKMDKLTDSMTNLTSLLTTFVTHVTTKESNQTASQ